MEKEDIIENTNEAIKTVKDYLEKCLANNDAVYMKKANILSYWLKDYIKYIEIEKHFNPVNLKTYKRGDVIKVNLGFNIGSELGGLHYCIVIDKKNDRNSPVLTVIPLSSKKTDKISKNSVDLGDDIYWKMINKSIQLFEDSKSQIRKNNILEFYKKITFVQQINKEIEKMKNNSIALVNQIRVTSKQRIYNPKTEFDVLSGIKLSNESLNLIDNKLKKICIKNEYFY